MRYYNFEKCETIRKRNTQFRQLMLELHSESARLRIESQEIHYRIHELMPSRTQRSRKRD